MSREISATTRPLATSSAATMSAAEYRQVASELGVQLREVVDLVDDAPDSPLRSAALGIFLKQIASIEELVTYAETGDELHRQTGVRLMDDALGDLSRLERTYGNASLILRR